MNKITLNRIIFIVLFTPIISSCTSTLPPRDINNVCNIFQQYPHWYKHTSDVEYRWKIPIHLQMAIIHQESKFNAYAIPPRPKILGILPWTRPSTAYGYPQALTSTWELYKQAADGGNFWATRHTFSHAVDFIGWYTNQVNKHTGIARDDAYNLYLAYHEGPTGYRKRTYLAKPWLIKVAQKVKALSEVFQKQLAQCKK